MFSVLAKSAIYDTVGASGLTIFFFCVCALLLQVVGLNDTVQNDQTDKLCRRS